MAAPSGISGQISWVSESTWATAVTTTLFHPGLISESISQEIARIESQGIRAGRRVGHTWAAGAKTIGGDIELELFNRPTASLLYHLFGSVNTTGAGPYTHTYTPGDLTGKSMTVQVGRPDVGGTVNPFTYAGVKIAAAELSCEVGSIPTLTLTVTAASETTATGLAVASYPASATPFTFVNGSLSIAGSSVATVRDMSLTIDNALETERFRIGSATTLQQLEAGRREITGSVSADFESLTHYARYTAGTEAALVMAFAAGTDSLTLTLNVRFDGSTPNLSGIELLEQPLSFKATSGTSDAAAVTAVLVNAESSATV